MVGLVRAITVKVSHLPDNLFLFSLIFGKARSSAKRKERLKNIQLRAGKKSTLTLLLDMKVRWSSTYNMLRRALELREVRSF